MLKMNKLTFNEKVAIMLISDQLRYHFGGVYNGFLAGHYDEKEYEEMVKEEEFYNMAEYILSNAYKVGYLDSESSNYVLEAKHLKFLGKEKLKNVIDLSVKKAISDF